MRIKRDENIPHRLEDSPGQMGLDVDPVLEESLIGQDGRTFARESLPPRHDRFGRRKKWTRRISAQEIDRFIAGEDWPADATE